MSDITSKGIPVIVLDGEPDSPGVYHLYEDSAYVTLSLEWVFKDMGVAGELIYSNLATMDFLRGLSIRS